METAESNSDTRPLVVVSVGTDHHPFDRLVGWCLALAEEGWARWFVQHGTSAWPASLPASASGLPMVDADTLGRLMAEAGCVVTHAGPGLLMDARRHGHVPIVVPRDPAFGEHVDGHQLRFSARVESTGRIVTGRSLAGLRREVRSALQQRRPACADAGPDPEVMERFAALVDATVGRRHGRSRS